MQVDVCEDLETDNACANDRSGTHLPVFAELFGPRGIYRSPCSAQIPISCSRRRNQRVKVISSALGDHRENATMNARLRARSCIVSLMIWK